MLRLALNRGARELHSDGYSSWMSVFRLRLRVRNRSDGYRYECFDRFEQLPSINMCLILNEMSFFSFIA